MTTPKPCPFCGAEAIFSQFEGWDIDHTENCFLNERHRIIRLDAWNLRYTDYVLRPEPLQPLKSYTDAVATQGCKVTKEVRE